MKNIKLILLSLSFLFVSCGRYITESGQASYYGVKFDGKKTASGEVFHQSELTAAHKTLPFGTKVQVKNLATGKTVKVRINDRGPYVAGRIIDLSTEAASRIGLISQGVGKVQIKYKKKRK